MGNRDDLGRFVLGHAVIGKPGRKVGSIPWNKGKCATEEARHNLSLAHIGKPSWNKGLSNYWAKGEKNCRWRGGVDRGYRRSICETPKYRAWRTAVFERDSYTCRDCGARGVRLEVHHIRSFIDFPEARLDIDNGLTLCKKCHRKKGRHKWQPGHGMRRTGI